jgi:imidazolonepropionase-like amidohydrolase
VLESGAEPLKSSSRVGVQVCHGTDLLAGMRRRQNVEFSLRKAVLTDLEILRSATLNTARYSGVGNHLGWIMCECTVDFLVLTNNPLLDVGILATPSDSIAAIIKSFIDWKSNCCISDGKTLMCAIAVIMCSRLYRREEQHSQGK